MRLRYIKAAGSGGGGGMTNPMTTAGDLIVGGSGGTPERLAVGVPGAMFLPIADGSLAWYRREQVVVIGTDFTRSVLDSDFFDFGSTGTASGASILAASSSVIDGACYGVAQFTTGSTATGNSYCFSASAASWISTAPARGTQYTRFSARVRLEDLSDGTQTFILRVGMLADNNDNNRGNWFRYTEATNSGKFQCLSRDASATTTADSGVIVAADTWYDLVIIHDGAGNAFFYINGVLVATNSVNTPTDYYVPAGFSIQKAVGLTARLAYLDYIQAITLIPLR